MKLKLIKPFLHVFLILILSTVNARTQSFQVTLDNPMNGSYKVESPLPADGKYPAETVLTVTATPAPGFVLDAGYFSVPGMW